MARFYNESTVPAMGTTYSSTSCQIRQLDLARSNSDANSVFLLTLAASNHSIPATCTPNTPTTLSSFPIPSIRIRSTTAPTAELFADTEEMPSGGVPVWPSGLEYEYDDDDDGHCNSHSTTRLRAGSGSYHWQAVEIHHGAARVKAWVKKTFTKIIPKRKKRLREEEGSRERMILD